MSLVLPRDYTSLTGTLPFAFVPDSRDDDTGGPLEVLAAGGGLKRRVGQSLIPPLHQPINLERAAITFFHSRTHHPPRVPCPGAST